MAYISFQPKDNFSTLLWTGNGSAGRAITGVGFQPDMVWIKNRSTTDNHAIFDATRGATYRIYPNDTDAQIQATNSLASFDSDGFTLNDGGDANGNGENIVGWNWKANGAGSANTDGSTNTTSTSANTTAGISIMKYGGTGSSATIGHGLSATPKVLLFKQLDGTESWRMWHRDAPNYSTKALALNLDSAEFSQSNWVGTVNNSTIALGADGSINLNAKNYICYAFAEKTGFSKFGTYIGNGSTWGTFVNCGFKPAWILVKCTTHSEYWHLYDGTRNPSNEANLRVLPNVNNAESTEAGVDLLSNGFKWRNSASNFNGSGKTYIYMAFAEEPLVASNGTPATAR